MFKYSVCLEACKLRLFKLQINFCVQDNFLTDISLSYFNALYFSYRKRTEELLRAARGDQVKNKEHFLAVQAARDRAEFERVLK